jgi:hypothetical protein
MVIACEPPELLGRVEKVKSYLCCTVILSSLPNNANHSLVATSLDDLIWMQLVTPGLEGKSAPAA